MSESRRPLFIEEHARLLFHWQNVEAKVHASPGPLKGHLSHAMPFNPLIISLLLLSLLAGCASQGTRQATPKPAQVKAQIVGQLPAKAQDRDVLEGYTRGADMYLTKPFNPIELVTFAKRLLQSGADDGRTVI